MIPSINAVIRAVNLLELNARESKLGEATMYALKLTDEGNAYFNQRHDFEQVALYLREMNEARKPKKKGKSK